MPLRSPVANQPRGGEADPTTPAPSVPEKTDLIMHRGTKECGLPAGEGGSMARMAEQLRYSQSGRQVGLEDVPSHGSSNAGSWWFAAKTPKITPLGDAQRLVRAHYACGGKRRPLL